MNPPPQSSLGGRPKSGLLSAFFVVLLCLSAPSVQASASPIESLRKAGKQARRDCERLLFTFSTAVLRLEAARLKPVEALRRFHDLSRNHLRMKNDSLKSRRELFRRQEQIEKVERRWSPVIEAALNEMQLQADPPIQLSPKNNKIWSYPLNRARFEKLYPRLARLVPSSARLYLTPFYNLAHGVSGAADENGIHVPLTVLWEGDTFENLQTMAHEAAHFRMAERRARLGVGQFGYAVETPERIWNTLARFMPPAYADNFFSEEIIPALITALNAVENSPSPDWSRSQTERDLRTLTQHLSASVELVLPALLKHVQGGKVPPGVDQIAISFENETCLVHIRDPRKVEWDLAADVKAELEILRKIKSAVDGWMARTDRSTEPLWELLKLVDLDPEDYRLATSRGR